MKYFFEGSGWRVVFAVAFVVLFILVTHLSIVEFSEILADRVVAKMLEKIDPHCMVK